MMYVWIVGHLRNYQRRNVFQATNLFGLRVLRGILQTDTDVTFAIQRQLIHDLGDTHALNANTMYVRHADNQL